jgi:hypothetical protein
VLNVLKRPEGPGEWREVRRGLQGLPHQSRMSGQEIVMRDGKLYIKEWGRYGTYFDDYKNGILYEYKGPYGNLMRKDGFFYDLPNIRKGALTQAENQLNSARGIPVVWRVGADQVKAFGELLRSKPQIMIIP